MVYRLLGGESAVHMNDLQTIRRCVCCSQERCYKEVCLLFTKMIYRLLGGMYAVHMNDLQTIWRCAVHMNDLQTIRRCVCCSHERSRDYYEVYLLFTVMIYRLLGGVSAVHMYYLQTIRRCVCCSHERATDY